MQNCVAISYLQWSTLTPNCIEFESQWKLVSEISPCKKRLERCRSFIVLAAYQSRHAKTRPCFILFITFRLRPLMFSNCHMSLRLNFKLQSNWYFAHWRHGDLKYSISYIATKIAELILRIAKDMQFCVCASFEPSGQLMCVTIFFWVAWRALEQCYASVTLVEIV